VALPWKFSAESMERSSAKSVEIWYEIDGNHPFTTSPAMCLLMLHRKSQGNLHGQLCGICFCGFAMETGNLG